MKRLPQMALIALVIRFIYFFQHMTSVFFTNPLLDQHYYDLCARQLSGAGGNIIDGFRPLLYPLFLSVFYTLNLEEGILFSILAQHLLGISMAVLIAWLATRLFNSTKAGLISGLLFCFSAPPLYFEGELLITTLFSFLLLLLWIAVFQALKSRTPRRAIISWLISGMVLGLATQARPNALPLLLIFPLISLFRIGSAKTGRRAACDTKVVVPQAARLPAWYPSLALLSLLLIQTSFGCINARYSGNFSLMTQAGGINLYLGNSQKADGMIPRQSKHVVYTGTYQDPIQVMTKEGYLESQIEEQKNKEVSQQDISNFWKNKTLDEIKIDPAHWLQLMAKKSWLMLWNHEVPNNRSFTFMATQETPILRWLPIRWAVLLFLFPWGVAALFKKKQYEFILWSLSFFMLFAGTVIFFFVNSRFRIPLWPGLAILGGGGATYLWKSITSKKLPILPITASLLLLLLSSFNWFNIPPDPLENDLSMRANAYYDQGRYEEALRDIQLCLEAAPNNPRYPFILGNILLAKGDYSTAIKAYLKAISLNPNDPIFYNNLGIAFENKGKPNHAIAAYQKALKLQPMHRAAKTNLFLLFIQTNQLAQAREISQHFSIEEKKLSLVQCATALLIYKETGNMKALRIAKEINPKLTKMLLHQENDKMMESAKNTSD